MKLLQGVAAGMAEVQYHPASGIFSVGLHKVPLDGDRAAHHLLQILQSNALLLRAASLKGLEQLLICYSSVLYHLAQTVVKVVLWQRGEGVRVAYDGYGLMEGPHQVLAKGQVHPGFAANACVRLGHHGGGDLGKVHPSEEGRRRKAAHVPGDPAAQSYNKVRAGKAAL